jgi:Phage integrase, N-terminal SAM-like domain
MRGNITRRGKSSWRLKFDVERDANGKRRFHTVTVRGTRKQAEEELTKLLAAADKGMLVDQNRDSVATYLRSWLNGQHDLAPSSIERYGDIIERRTIPYIGDIELQKLKPIPKVSGLEGRNLSTVGVPYRYRCLLWNCYVNTVRHSSSFAFSLEWASLSLRPWCSVTMKASLSRQTTFQSGGDAPSLH